MKLTSLKAIKIVCTSAFILAGVHGVLAQDPPGQLLGDGVTISGSTLTGTYTDLSSSATQVPGTDNMVTSFSIDAATITGTLASTVWENDGNNKFGADDYTFRYVITVATGTIGSLDNDGGASGTWGDIITYVGENNGDGGSLASSVSRGPDGKVITWDWSPGVTGSQGGTKTAVLIVETDTDGYTTGGFTIGGSDPQGYIGNPLDANGGGTSVPDGACTMALLGFSASLLGMVRRFMARP
jgi:hypothetical protein